MDKNVSRRHVETVVHTVGVAQYDKREVRSGHGITKLKFSTAIVRIVDDKRNCECERSSHTDKARTRFFRVPNALATSLDEALGLQR